MSDPAQLRDERLAMERVALTIRDALAVLRTEESWAVVAALTEAMRVAGEFGGLPSRSRP